MLRLHSHMLEFPLMKVLLESLRRSPPQGPGKMLMLWWNPDSVKQHTQVYNVLRFLQEKGTAVRWNTMFHFRFSPLWKENYPSAKLPAKSFWSLRITPHNSIFTAIVVFFCSFMGFHLVSKDWNPRLIITTREGWRNDGRKIDEESEDDDKEGDWWKNSSRRN